MIKIIILALSLLIGVAFLLFSTPKTEPAFSSVSEPFIGVEFMPDLSRLTEGHASSFGQVSYLPSKIQMDEFKAQALASAVSGNALDAAAFVEKLRVMDRKSLLGMGEILFDEKGTTPGKRALEQTLAAVLAEVSPREAADLFSGEDRPGYNHVPAEIVITAWVEADSDGALDWFISEHVIEDSDFSEVFLKSLIQEDVEMALHLAEDLPWERQKRIILQLKPSDLDGALAFLDAVPQSTSVMRLKGIVGRRYARTGNRKKAQRLLSELDSSTEEWQEMALRLVVPVISTWDADESFRSRVDWLMAKSTPEAKPAQVASITRHWVREDATATSEWLAVMAAGPARDQGYAHFARMRRKADPSGAFEWAAMIGDEDLRNEIATLVVEDWLDVDSTAASARWASF